MAWGGASAGGETLHRLSAVVDAFATTTADHRVSYEGRSAPNALQRSVSTESVTGALRDPGPTTLGDVRTLGDGGNVGMEGPAAVEGLVADASGDGKVGDRTAEAHRSSAAALRLLNVQEEIDAARRRYKPVASKRSRRKSLADLSPMLAGGGGGGGSKGVRRNTSMEMLAVSARLRQRHSADRLPMLGPGLQVSPHYPPHRHGGGGDRESLESHGSSVAGSGRLLRRGGSITKTSDSIRLEM